MGMFQISCLEKSGFWSGRGVRQVCLRFLMSDISQLTDYFPYIFYKTSIYITAWFYWCKWFFAYNINKSSRYFLILGEKATEVNYETENTNSRKQTQQTRFNTVSDIIPVPNSIVELFDCSIVQMFPRSFLLPCSLFFCSYFEGKNKDFHPHRTPQEEKLQKGCFIPAAGQGRTSPVHWSCFFLLHSIVELFDCSIVQMFPHSFQLQSSLFL